MLWRHYLWTSLLLAFTSATEDVSSPKRRTLTRLVGGHLRILDQETADSELLPASAGAGREKSAKSDQDEKKTLAQQVKDGKYGLIQKELFSKPAKRPGIISYKGNSEVPKDNINTLGGLQKNEIWLAENHLLVLKGGVYPEHEDHQDNSAPIWPPIDNYKAPERQVKIPAHPKVPPPFPVQLTEDGPLQLLGTNSSRTLNGTGYETLPPPDGYVPGTGPFFPPLYPNSANFTPGQAPFAAPPDFTTAFPGEYRPGDGPPPFPLNGTWPPSLGSLPPGAAILPPPDNLTDYYDEDDPSIYYPPPYSFFYPKDNSTEVPPGPLVPGIILPPPPDFFAPLEEKMDTRKTTQKPRERMRKPTTTKPPDTTTETIRVVTPQKPRIVVNRNQSYSTTTTRVHKKKPQSVTILRPVKPSTQPPIYYKENEVSGKPFLKYGPPERPVVTTEVPLKLYYTTPKIKVQTSAALPEISINLIPKTTVAPPQYYYYEEDKRNRQTTQAPVYRPQIPTEYFRQKPTVAPKRNHPTNQNIRLYYVTSTPLVTQRPKYRLPEPSDTFSIHIAKLKDQIHQYVKPKEEAQPVYQYSFQTADYPQQHQQNLRGPKYQNQQYQFNPKPPRYSVQIQQAVEITPPQLHQHSTRAPVYYQDGFVPSNFPQQQQYAPQRQQTPRPITQYNYEVTPNPIYQNSYTKLDEHYFDDITKNYFTTFGQKLPSSTTPLPPQNVPEQQYVQKPISLEADTLVNYVQPRPQINPDAEYITPVNVKPIRYVDNKPKVPERDRRPYHNERGSYVSYQLPGDNAHFYFLTPQLVKRTDQGVGYYFAQPNTTSVLRGGQ